MDEPMISVAQADRLIRRAVRSAPTVTVPLADASGAVLREPVRADRPLPPYDRVMMDGVALSFAAWRRGCREFECEGIQRAGDPPGRRRRAHGCLEVMTGAVLPRGCDCVVPVEQLQPVGDRIRVTGRVDRGQFIDRAGADARRGAVLLTPGQVLDGPAIAVAASVGKARLRVARPPRVAIVSTGDELVEVHERPAAHQIRRSNPHALAASLRLHGVRTVTLAHVTDHPGQQARVLRRMLARADVVVLTGGVSKGRYDFVPGVLERIGVRQVFHRVRQRPGKPLWFGVGPQRQLVFGLPGNPVSCLVCLHRYVLPVLGTGRAPASVRLARRLPRGKLTVFPPVRLGIGGATPVATNTSGDFRNLARSDGFIELPAGTGYLRGGSMVRFWAWR
ncbi:molybdopterin molybdotransferase MoeA [bacterium]|nr:molybdopterin molybdotransferase MoeA [bacterium]